MSAHAGGGGAEAEWTEAHDERYEWVTRRYAATTLVAARARPPADRTAGAARDGAGRRTSAAGVEARQAEGHGDAVGDGGAVGRAARDRTARARPGAGRGLYRMDRSGAADSSFEENEIRRHRAVHRGVLGGTLSLSLPLPDARPRPPSTVSPSDFMRKRARLRFGKYLRATC